MKNYARIILYTYPLLRTVEKDYEEHIGNKAILSYEGRWTAEQTAEYIAGEILEMRRLEWLKNTVRGILEKLSKEERALVAMRYFGKKKILKTANGGDAWTERSYFRKQAKLGEKLGEAFVLSGLTEELFIQEFAKMDIFRKVERVLEKRRMTKKSV